MRLRGVVVLALLCAGCGGAEAPTSPTPPVPDSPSFLTGQYYLQLNAFDFSDNPQIPACPGFIGVPRAGKSVTVVLTVTREGAEWVGRPSTGGADMELRFRETGVTLFGRTFSGTLRGRGSDQQLPFFPAPPPNGVSVSVAGTAPGAAAIVEGQTLGHGRANTLTGRAMGEFRFDDAAGALATCGTVAVHINVIVPNTTN